MLRNLTSVSRVALRNPIQITRYSKKSVNKEGKAATLDVLKQAREKQLKNKIEHRLKKEKNLGALKSAKTSQNKELRLKESLMKKESRERVRKIAREAKEKLKAKLKAAKLQAWIRSQKEKEKEAFAKMKERKFAKKKKDENAPVRPKNAHLWFYTKNFDNIKANVQVSGKGFIGACAQEARRQWNELSKEKRDIYENLAKEDRERYAIEKQRYINGKNSHKKPRALTPYIRYMKIAFPSVKHAHPEFTKVTQIVKVVAEQWKSLSQMEKEKFVAEYEKDRAGLGETAKKRVTKAAHN